MDHSGLWGSCLPVRRLVSHLVWVTNRKTGSGPYSQSPAHLIRICLNYQLCLSTLQHLTWTGLNPFSTSKWSAGMGPLFSMDLIGRFSVVSHLLVSYLEDNRSRSDTGQKAGRWCPSKHLCPGKSACSWHQPPTSSSSCLHPPDEWFMGLQRFGILRVSVGPWFWVPTCV